MLIQNERNTCTFFTIRSNSACLRIIQGNFPFLRACAESDLAHLYEQSVRAECTNKSKIKLRGKYANTFSWWVPLCAFHSGLESKWHIVVSSLVIIIEETYSRAARYSPSRNIVWSRDLHFSLAIVSRKGFEEAKPSTLSMPSLRNLHKQLE